MQLLICGTSQIKAEEAYISIQGALNYLKSLGLQYTSVIIDDEKGVCEAIKLFVEDKEKHKNCYQLLSLLDVPVLVEKVDPAFKMSARLHRNKRAVRMSDMVLAIWDGKCQHTLEVIKESTIQAKIAVVYSTKTWSA